VTGRRALLAGAAALAAPRAAGAGGKSRKRPAVILFWLSGGLSHIDSWDPKPDAPEEPAAEPSADAEKPKE